MRLGNKPLESRIDGVLVQESSVELVNTFWHGYVRVWLCRKKEEGRSDLLDLFDPI